MMSACSGAQAAALAQIWPDICSTLGIQCNDPPPADSVKLMWPIVEKLVEAISEVEIYRPADPLKGLYGGGVPALLHSQRS